MLFIEPTELIIEEEGLVFTGKTGVKSVSKEGHGDSVLNCVLEGCGTDSRAPRSEVFECASFR